VSAGQVSLYRPDDSRVIPPSELRTLIGKAEREFRRDGCKCSGACSCSGDSNVRQVDNDKCPGCGRKVTTAEVRQLACASNVCQRWHRACWLRTQARHPISAGRPVRRR
jgi:hypothetical protein